MEATIRQIHEQLATNDVAAALQKLRSVFSIAGSPLVNDAVILTGRYSKLRSEVRRGTVEVARENVRHNQILEGILSLVDELRREPGRFAQFAAAQNGLDRAVANRGAPQLPTWIRDALFDRIAHAAERDLAVAALWVDDTPDHNRYECGLLATLGLRVDQVTSSEAARQRLAAGGYQLLLSDITRPGPPAEGLRFHRELVDRGTDLPTIFYVGHADRSAGVPPFAFGIADQPGELLHLVLDVLDRIPRPAADGAP